ncbi:hypothetical protein J2S43_007534 [Catenuloplanes nepalensis]|uniref:C2H2-type domain-containing protein n=1 Tax=Catenuloplanes nepalensis TaxID=587533 RepID=A0ABT9N5P2_9ACTN|nr:hypothetical protein [Catenuloplanes nepalensis]MDP9799022.1 hypothetical protein [Catenuloplanes nepalensis]
MSNPLVAPRIATVPRARRLPLPLFWRRPLPLTRHAEPGTLPNGVDTTLCLHCLRLFPVGAIDVHIQRHRAIPVRGRFFLRRRRVLSLTEMQALTRKES